MAEEKDKKLINALLFTNLSTRLSLFFEYGIKLTYFPRAIFMLIDSLLISPINWIEELIYQKRIDETEIQQAPLFIIGHWRSGTTHLHNLLSLDSQFAYYRTFDALFPKASILLACTQSLFETILPKTRLIDNVSLSTDSPQEEEFGIARLSKISFYHCFTYPDQMQSLFDKYILLHGTNESERTSLKRIIKFLIQKVAFMNPGKTVLFKNPINTARIELLLEIFPNAKFIYIERNPYELFESTKNMFKKVQNVSRLQELSDDELNECIFSQYKKLLNAYRKQKNLIQKNNLCEIYFQDLVKDPIYTIQKTYEQLGLDLSEDFHQSLRQYLSSLKSYKRNEFSLDSEIKARIEKEWMLV